MIYSKEQGFAKDFILGVAAASYQIEGAAWAAGRGCSIWDTFCRMPGRVLHGDTGDTACDHYHLYEDDLDLMKNLGVDSYRFSIAWPRIFPEGSGRIEPKGLDFYDRLTDAMLERQIVPNATLYHWDLPQNLEDAGGWVSRDTAQHFADYTAAVLKRLGDRLAMVSTLNEPWCSSFLGYLSGIHAPGKKNQSFFMRAVHHLNLAHGLAVPVIRELAPGAKAGIVLNLAQAYPDSGSEDDRSACARFDSYNNGIFLGPLFQKSYPADVTEAFGHLLPGQYEQDLPAICQPLDFIGLNYYTSHWIRGKSGAYPGARTVTKGLPVTDMGWEIYPQGLYDLLTRLGNEAFAPEIYVTENGSAWPDVPTEQGEINDTGRTDYLLSHLGAVQKAIAEGVPVKGYYAWSVMDNFEWALGYDKRFGLVYVDYATQKRSMKQSAYTYQDIIKSR